MGDVQSQGSKRYTYAMDQAQPLNRVKPVELTKHSPNSTCIESWYAPTN